MAVSYCGPVLHAKVTAQPVHGMRIEVGARRVRQVWVDMQSLWSSDAFEHRQNRGCRTDCITHADIDQGRAANGRHQVQRIKVGQRVEDGLPFCRMRGDIVMQFDIGAARYRDGHWIVAQKRLFSDSDPQTLVQGSRR